MKDWKKQYKSIRKSIKIKRTTIKLPADRILLTYQLVGKDDSIPFSPVFTSKLECKIYRDGYFSRVKKVCKGEDQSKKQTVWS